MYFSGSFSLLPDPLGALMAARRLLSPGGSIFITQTFQRHGFPGLSIIKPMVKWVSTIDFGRLVYESEIESIIKCSGMNVVVNDVISGSVDNFFQAAHIIELTEPSS